MVRLPAGEPPEPERQPSAADVASLVQAFLRQEHRRLREMPHGPGRGTSAEKLNRRRHARRAVQAIRKRLRAGGRRPVLSTEHLLTQFREDSILGGLLADRASRWTPVLRRVVPSARVEVDLERFSFIDEPSETLAALRRIAEVECEGLDALLHFRDAYCLDIGAYLVLGEVWPRLAPFFSGGHMGVPVQKVMEAVGLRRLMNMRLSDLENLDDVWAFPVRRRSAFGDEHVEPERLLRPQREQVVADEFCDAVDGWLGVSTRQLGLTDDGRAWIQTIILELLDNARRHSAPATKDGNRSIAGFMARRRGDDGVYAYRCYLRILSVGATIDESLVTCSPRTAAQMEDYVGRHGGCGRSRETLRTLFALQDAVTRDAEADAEGRGGFGFQEVMRLVDLLGLSDNPLRDPRLTIVSGNACIVVRRPYMRGVQMAGADSPRVLWFNPGNSPDEPPDPSHVFDLRDRLAGSIISLAFTLDPDFLNAVVPDDGRDQPAGSDRGR